MYISIFKHVVRLLHNAFRLVAVNSNYSEMCCQTLAEKQAIWSDKNICNSPQQNNLWLFMSQHNAKYAENI